MHVGDVCGALWHVATTAEPAPVYNLADASNSTQGSIAALLEQLFNIKTGFVGNLASQAVKTVGLKGFAEGANEKHMAPWGELCKAASIANTPLTPCAPSPRRAFAPPPSSSRWIPRPHPPPAGP